ncbi:MAG: hypothetical protein A4E19_14160 [Nitrospira sp. SG-bin1]|nr:MAG: hypothetical protein A4E19_14160 [Nitrospira sp. SG-bin1]
MKYAFWLSTGLVGSLLVTAPVLAEKELQVVDNQCWAEIFEDSDFDKNDPHLKIQGPAQIPTLKDYKGRNWNDEIQSIIVGPNATVKAYSKKDYAGTELVLTPNKRVAELSEYNLSDDIESMTVTCGG